MVARRVVAGEIVDADLTVEADGGARDQRFAVLHAGAVDGVAGGEVVAAVEDDVGGGDARVELGAGQPALQRHHFDRGIQCG